jgi:ligand-binding sensor domain-containing protein
MRGQLPPFHHYDTGNGLVNNVVYNLHEAKDGAIWFCTEGGVSRFDSHKFENFTVADGLNSNTITAILETDSGFVFSQLCE